MGILKNTSFVKKTFGWSYATASKLFQKDPSFLLYQLISTKDNLQSELTYESHISHYLISNVKTFPDAIAVNPHELITISYEFCCYL